MYCASIQLECDGWILHYPWYYHADSFEAALGQAIDHFDQTQRGKLLSIGLTDGKQVLTMRSNPATGERYVRIVDVNKPPDDLLGPDSSLTKEYMQ